MPLWSRRHKLPESFPTDGKSPRSELVFSELRSRLCFNRKPGLRSHASVETGISFVPGNVGWHRGGPRNRRVGAPTRVTTGPSERPRGDGDPGRLPSSSRAHPHHASSQAKSQTVASPDPLTILVTSWLREYPDRSPVSLSVSTTFYCCWRDATQ
jgi:hypothetical protein